MTSGPEARVCEIVENTLPRGRSRSDLHRHENYSPMRNHLLEFLVNRSSVDIESHGLSRDPVAPPVVRPVQLPAMAS